MLLNLVNLLSGTVQITVESGFPERVLNLCSAHELPFWDLVWQSPTTFSVKLQRRHYYRLRQLVKKLDCTIVAEQRQGVPFFVARFRKRYALLAGLVLACSLFVAGSFFIWRIDVEGNQTVPEARLLRALEAEGVRRGAFGLAIHPETVKNHVLLEIPELSWLTVNVSGFRATVIVRERIRPPEVRREHIPANVVAEKDGLITEVKLYGGHAAVQKGDTVTEGQLLISGVADIGSEGFYLTRGDGEVWARTWYTLTAKVPKTVVEKVCTGREKREYALHLGKRRIKILRGSSIYGPDCDKITENGVLCLPGGVSLERTTLREYQRVPRSLTLQEAQERAQPHLRIRLKDCLHEGGTVKNSTFSTKDCGDGYEVTLRAECEEQIGRTAEFVDE